MYSKKMIKKYNPYTGLFSYNMHLQITHFCSKFEYPSCMSIKPFTKKLTSLKTCNFKIACTVKLTLRHL